MNSKINYVALLLIVIIAFGCKNSKESTIIPEGLTLNNGEKWVVNKETHVGMKRIDSILKHNTSLNGKTLGEAISKETSYIIKSCNMKGIAHDQLHVILVPILEETIEIKDTQQTDQLNNRITYIKSLMNTYFKYFKHQ